MGRWYWVTPSEKEEEEEEGESGKKWLGCVTEVGSNYAEIHAAAYSSSYIRIHLDEFWDMCEFEPNPDAYIEQQVEKHQREANRLMGKVRDITARLAISPAQALPAHSETQALALRSGDQPVDEYKAALILAKDKELPELFEQIRQENSAMGQWMKAKLIPLEAQVGQLTPAISAIKNRIFSVELYAGLVEQVEQVRKGDPASIDTKIHLMQRRCYMDEECLANYKTGGMEFKNLKEFDRWLGKKENLERILPFPRCIVAFQVRRHDKDREWENLRDYFRMLNAQDLDKLTFLYIRNGDQLFRLDTAIEFGADLFPDMSENPMGLGEKTYVKMYGSHVSSIISEGRYLEMIAEEKAEEAAEKKKKGIDRCFFMRYESKEYQPFTQDNVYYDDILKHIQEEMARHNRLVLVLQGLLDRSPVLHPHPPWSLWDAGGFQAALQLVYDDSRALTPGAAPDFEEYRRKCNESLKDGSVTVGQEVQWEIREANKENDRRDADYRTSRSDYRPERYRPHGDPGPGTLARVVKWQPKTKTCFYAWDRERRDWNRRNEGGIRCTLTCSASHVLNIDAYKPGDFKIFFSDPRTRADYLKWAPLLLEAEEYHAGNRKPPPIVGPAVPLRSTWEGRRKYQNRKMRKMLMGKAVRLLRSVTMKSGRVYQKNSLWRVVGGQGSAFEVRAINKDGTWMEDYQAISNLSRGDFELDLSVPEAAAKT